MSITEEQLQHLATGEFGGFEPGWAAALDFADELTRTGGKVRDEVYGELARHFGADQIVEITAAAALFNYFNRFANSLNIPVTR